MGLFRSSRRISQATGWRTDEHGLGLGPDSVNDLQIGQSWLIRIVRADKPCSLIDVTHFAFADADNPGEYGVTRQIEWLVCEDPADPWATEVWSDAEESDVNDMVMGREEAITYARTCAEQDLPVAAELYGGWDGEPDWRTS